MQTPLAGQARPLYGRPSELSGSGFQLCPRSFDRQMPPARPTMTQAPVGWQATAVPRLDFAPPATVAGGSFTGSDQVAPASVLRKTFDTASVVPSPPETAMQSAALQETDISASSAASGTRSQVRGEGGPGGVERSRRPILVGQPREIAQNFRPGISALERTLKGVPGRSVRGFRIGLREG
jgi:hypothetical protein